MTNSSSNSNSKFLTVISRYIPWIGLALIASYWWSIHPLVYTTGYVEDFCADVLRQIMAENLEKYGKPTFHTDSLMTPFGASVPYLSWNIERDWLGAYLWRWFPKFPFLFAYFGLSLLITYVGVGNILKKMNLARGVAWGLATLVILFHIPRHFKAWHHFEHMTEHWLYLSLFMDAWIWQRFWRERRWSLHLELWRGVLLLAVLLSTGYFWGAMVLEWLIVHGSILGVLYARQRKGIKTQIELPKKQIALPIVVGCILLAIEVRWFLGLYEEVKHLGKIFNNVGWFAYFYYPFVPLWLSRILTHTSPFYEWSETITSVGWVLVIPLFLSFYSLRKRSGGPGMGAILPFFIFIILAYLWQSRILPRVVIDTFRSVVPFLEFFRVGARWSLLMPALIGTILALAWPELSQKLSVWYRTRKNAKVWVALFVLSSLGEASWLLHPTNMLAPMPSSLENLLSQAKALPGEAIVDLPFCVAGGNGYCTAEQCPNYPFSSVGQCLRMFHDKKVYGLYQARMTASHCQAFNRPPFLSWFSAWGSQRCFSDPEWTDFCAYLDQHPETSGILLYPDIWVGAGNPACLGQFEAHLGKPLAEAVMPKSPSLGGKWTSSSRVMLYSGKCVKR